MNNNNNETEETTMTDDDVFTVCEDCALVLAGECGGPERHSGAYDEWAAYHDDGMAQWEWVGLGRLHGDDHCGQDHTTDASWAECETITFARSSCGICTTTVGGFRFYVMAERAGA